MKVAYKLFGVTAMLCLLSGLLMGLLAGSQFLYPELTEGFLPFQSVRPLHVSFGIWWIFLGASSAVYFFIDALTGDSEVQVNESWLESTASTYLAVAHYVLWTASGLAVIYCYANGIFGGKEYLNYPPFLSIPIALGWLMFAINLLKSVGGLRSKWPVFMWMWFTSCAVFLVAFAEAHLWTLPWFGGNIIRDVTVQWKSYGSLVASWNMLIYGTVVALMYFLSRDKNALRGGMVFLLYFLGLINSLFNWGHHTYTLPTASYVREVAYVISMLELYILWRIIWTWSKGWDSCRDLRCYKAYMFLMATDVWLLLNLVLAIALSIPALNVFAHGTHIIVAHSMGATIGINSMILLGALHYMVQQRQPAFSDSNCRIFKTLFYGLNLSLLIFWIALLGAGVEKAILIAQDPYQSYRVVLAAIRPYIMTMVAAGVVLMTCFFSLLLPLLYRYIASAEDPEHPARNQKWNDTHAAASAAG